MSYGLRQVNPKQIPQNPKPAGVSKGVSPLAAREKEGVIGGEKTLL